MEFTKEFLYQYLTEHKDEMFADLGYIVSFPSIKSAAEEGAPFGPESAKCLKATAELYRKYGFDAEVYDDLGYGMAYYGQKPVENDAYMGVIAHTDVVPVTPEDWILTEPFKMLDTGENVVGRGVGDNKNAVVGALYIMRAMKACGYEPKHKICIILGSNEEAGMVDIRNFKKYHNPLPKVCLVPDAAFSVSFGERGSFYAEIKSGEPLVDIVDIHGGKANNIVLGKLECEIKKLPGLFEFLENNKQDWLVYEDAGETLKLVASGIPAHGGRPFKGESAFARLSALLAQFDGFCESDHYTLAQCADMLSDCYGIALGIDNEDPDMGKLTDANGRVFVEDGKLVFTNDIRFGPGVDHDGCKEKLRANVEARGFGIYISKGSKSFRIDPENPMAVAVLNAYRTASGKEDAKPYFMSGGTYSKIMQPEVMSFSTGVHVGGGVARLNLPSGHGNAHESDETIGKEELIQGLCILATMMTELDDAY